MAKKNDDANEGGKESEDDAVDDVKDGRESNKRQRSGTDDDKEQHIRQLFRQKLQSWVETTGLDWDVIQGIIGKEISKDDPVMGNVTKATYPKNFGFKNNQSPFLLKFGGVHFAFSSEGSAKRAAKKFPELFKTPQVPVETCNRCGRCDIDSFLDLIFHRHHQCCWPIPPVHDRDCEFMVSAFVITDLFLAMLERTTFEEPQDLISTCCLPYKMGRYHSQVTSDEFNLENAYLHSNKDLCTLFSLVHMKLKHKGTLEITDEDPANATSPTYAFISGLPFIKPLHKWPLNMQNEAKISNTNYVNLCQEIKAQSRAGEEQVRGEAEDAEAV
jgi:hypothetical protein